MSIIFENVVLPSPDHMNFIISGIRSLINCLKKSDSHTCCSGHCEGRDCIDCPEKRYFLGPNDLELIRQLEVKDDTYYFNLMRMLSVYVKITAPLYWWSDFGIGVNPCDTMCMISEKEFTIDDFSAENLISDDPFYRGNRDDDDQDIDVGIPDPEEYIFYKPKEILTHWVIPSLNACRAKYLKTKDKKYWWQIIQLLPNNYNLTYHIMLTYEDLANIYKSRRIHKIDEWDNFCKWIESLPCSELIIGGSIDEK